MGRYLISTIKTWNIDNYRSLKNRFSEHSFRLVTDRDELTVELLNSFHPDYIFFPHWSWIIPASIYENYNCVVFHMTDLPFGRGGSPLQNLIVRGIYETKISAIKVSKGMDTGDIYFKEGLDISTGSADEVFKRVSHVVFNTMIPRFFNGNPIATPQKGEVVEFNRRTPDQSEIPNGLNSRQLYDYIRMLDGEGYPMAYTKYGTGRLFYSDAEYDGKSVIAKVQFVEDA